MRRGLWLALAASVGVAAWLALQPDADDTAAVVPVATRRTDVAAPPRQGSAPATSPRGITAPLPRTNTRQPDPQPTATAAALPARAADWPAASPAALLAWGAPPPPPPAAARNAQAAAASAPAAPRAPPFPYQWIGTLDDGLGRQALLGGPVRSAVVRAGQVLDGQWRVEQVRDGQLDLTWLPGGQTLSVRGQATAGRAAPPAPSDDNPGSDS